MYSPRDCRLPRMASCRMARSQSDSRMLSVERFPVTTRGGRGSIGWSAVAIWCREAALMPAMVPPMVLVVPHQWERKSNDGLTRLPERPCAKGPTRFRFQIAESDWRGWRVLRLRERARPVDRRAARVEHSERQNTDGGRRPVSRCHNVSFAGAGSGSGMVSRHMGQSTPADRASVRVGRSATAGRSPSVSRHSRDPGSAPSTSQCVIVMTAAPGGLG